MKDCCRCCVFGAMVGFALGAILVASNNKAKKFVDQTMKKAEQVLEDVKQKLEQSNQDSQTSGSYAESTQDFDNEQNGSQATNSSKKR